MKVSLKKRQAARENIDLEMPDDTIIKIKPILSLELAMGFEAIREALDTGAQFQDDPYRPGRKLSQVETILRNFMDESQWEAFYQSCWNREEPTDFRDLSAIMAEIFNMKTDGLDAPLSVGSGSSIRELPNGGRSTPSLSSGDSAESTEQISPIG